MIQDTKLPSSIGNPGCAWFSMDPTLKTYIVEDNVTIRENLVGTLEELTCISAIGFAETEADASRWLNENSEEWELAIVDLFLKQGSGLGVLQTCMRRRPEQKVVVLSNYATPDIRKRCAQFGVDAVFDKSNEIDALIDYCIEQSGTLRPAPGENCGD
jgi:DNA-binding NarL/FixJ family response regulator